MKLTYYITAILVAFSFLLFTSCEEKLPTEFGNSNIYFSNPVYSLTYKSVDTLNLDIIKAEADTIYNVCGVYRSGIVDNLEEITVSVAIDSASLDSTITAAQTALPINMTSLMTTYKFSKALGGHYFSAPQTVTIPKGERSVVVPITVKRSLIKLYNNAKFNYNSSDLLSTSIPKDKFLVLPLKITTVSSLSILATQKNYYFKILKNGNLK
jgi:hypothetical protein